MATTGSIEHRGSKGEGSSGATTREQRGIALYLERGDEIVAYVDGTFGVPSRTEEDVIYHVDLEGGTCQCADYLIEAIHRSNPYHLCLHIYAGELKRIERSLRRAFGRRGQRPRRSRCSRKAAA